jgi:Flp pilus assembly protein TadG
MTAMRGSLRKFLARTFRHFRRADDGVAGVEFAFAAPVVIFAAVGVIELGTMMFTNTLMEGGLRDAARFGITGYAPAGVSREDRIREIIEENTIGLIDMQTATITQLIYPSFGDIGKPEPYIDDNPANGQYDPGESYQDINGNAQWDPDMGAAGVDGAGAVVLYTVEVDWPALTPLFKPIFNGIGKIRMRASVAVRNEPF